MSDQSEKLAELQRSSDENVFIMMRYRSSAHFKEIEASIREGLADYGLNARFAKDSAIVDDLWQNIVHYMKNCRYGLAVFEDIDEREFNPNISLELGYMYALNRRCLLLKEKRMPRLPVDICGRIYRDFDALNIRTTVINQINEWCERDLGLICISKILPATHVRYVIVYDNKTQDPEFRTWGMYSSIGYFSRHINLKNIQDESNESRLVLELTTDGTESIGVNKEFPSLKGRVRFNYKAEKSSASNLNLLFCMIPMKGQLCDLIEVGANVMDEFENAYSPYRVRYFVPQKHVGDLVWHEGIIDFDFTEIPSASYSIFAPRINEGCPRPGAGNILLKDIQFLAVS